MYQLVVVKMYKMKSATHSIGIVALSCRSWSGSERSAQSHQPMGPRVISLLRRTNTAVLPVVEGLGVLLEIQAELHVLEVHAVGISFRALPHL